MLVYELSGCGFDFRRDVFSVLKEAGYLSFNKVVRLIASNFFDEYLKLPASKEEWESEVCRFIKNYGSPFVGAWDAVDVYINSKLKSIYNFKKKNYQ